MLRACAPAVRCSAAGGCRSRRTGPWSRQVLGPAPAPVVKVNNRYRYRLTVVGQNERTARVSCWRPIMEALRPAATEHRSMACPITDVQL